MTQDRWSSLALILIEQGTVWEVNFGNVIDVWTKRKKKFDKTDLTVFKIMLFLCLYYSN